MRSSIWIAIALITVLAVSAKPSDCTTIQDGGLTDTLGNPITVGYDQWGYNYQARSFNGWYDNYARPTPPVTEGDVLAMKWNDAWLSNKDCDGDTKLDRHYGFASYIGSGAWLTNHANGTYEMSDWVLEGSKLITFTLGGDYTHDAVFTDVGGVLSGNGGYPAGGPYTYEWLITNGSVTGNTIAFSADYTAGAIGTTMHVTGTIAADGSASGTWDDNFGGYRAGTWTMPAGSAAEVITQCTWTDFVKIVAAPADAYNDGTNWYSADDVLIGPMIWGEFAIIQEESTNPCGKDLGLLNFESDLRTGLGNW